MEFTSIEKRAILKYVRSKRLDEYFVKIISILGGDWSSASQFIAEDLITKYNNEIQKNPQSNYTLTYYGELLYNALMKAAAIELAKKYNERGRRITKKDIKREIGYQSSDIIDIYHQAGLKHAQETRNLRHNMFHLAFLDLIRQLAPYAKFSIPQVGQGNHLTPDLMAYNENPKWILACEYKAYRSFFPLAESEILKAIRYAHEFGTAWLITTSIKSSIFEYGEYITPQELYKKGKERYKIIINRPAYTRDQKEIRGIAYKGLKQLEKHKDDRIRVKYIPLDELLEDIRNGTLKPGATITTGLEYIELLEQYGLDEEADMILKVMKKPTIYSSTIISTKLIDEI